MKPPILMIHGVGCTGTVWDIFVRVLSGLAYRCDAPTLAADRRLATMAPVDLADLTFADLVEESAGRARALAAETGQLPVVIGHSMGGLIAQKLAEAGLVAAAVLIAPASPPEVVVKPTLGQLVTFANIIFARKNRARVYKIWRAGFRWGVLNRTPSARHAAIYRAAVYDSGHVFAALGGSVDTPQRRQASIDPKRVSVPILLLVGLDDRVTPPASVRSVATFYPGSVYREYSGHGHWIMDEPGAAALASEVAAWIMDWHAT